MQGPVHAVLSLHSVSPAFLMSLRCLQKQFGSTLSQQSIAITSASTVMAKTAKTAAAAGPKPQRAPTPFELRIHEVCRKIPQGRVSTYGTIAKVLNSAPRAVGQALRRNPYAPEVPCHRVITSSLELGGFQGAQGVKAANVQCKRKLLEKEGLSFSDDGKLVSDRKAVMDVDDF